MAVVGGFGAIEAIRRGQFVQMGFSPTSCFPKKKKVVSVFAIVVQVLRPKMALCISTKHYNKASLPPVGICTVIYHS